MATQLNQLPGVDVRETSRRTFMNRGSMLRKFFVAYLKFIAIAVGLVLLAAAAYFVAYKDQDQRGTDGEVTSVVKRFDELYGRQAREEDKREVIIKELTRERRSAFRQLMLEHLAEALLLAAIMILTVEGLTKYMASEEEVDNAELMTKQLQEQASRVSDNVWNAIFERLVPDQVADEVKKILKSDVCRVKPQYTIMFMENTYTDLGSEYIIVKRQLYYRLFNLTGGLKDFLVKIQLRSNTGVHAVTDVNGTQVTLPRICEVQVDGKRMELPDGHVSAYERSIPLKSMTREEQAIAIYSEADEVCRLTDRALYVLTLPCYGLEVQVINHIPHLIKFKEDNIYLTSGLPLRLTTPQKWECDGGLLPGTALSLSWTAVPKTL